MTTALTELLLFESPDAVVVITPDGKVVHWNQEAEKVFGYLASEAVGSFLDALIIPPDQKEEDRRFRQEAVQHGRSTFEGSRTRKDGTLIYAVISNKAV